MRSYLLVGLSLAAAVGAWHCGGGSSSSMTSPGSPSADTINIVGITGNQAFSPNPIEVASGTAVVWSNNTAVTHHIVMDSGTVVGDIAPGASSTPMQVGSGNYHCTIHPSMVGSVNGAVAPTPAPGSGGGY